MDKAQKHAFVKEMNTQLQNAQLVVVGHYRGLTVRQFENLRGQMREDSATIKVAKNRLARIAFQGTPFTALDEIMTGPTAISYSADEVSAAKVAQKFADKHEHFTIVGGALGDKLLSAADVKALSAMPSLDGLRSILVGLIQAPATKLACITAAPASGLARQIAQKPETA